MYVSPVFGNLPYPAGQTLPTQAAGSLHLRAAFATAEAGCWPKHVTARLLTASWLASLARSLAALLSLVGASCPITCSWPGDTSFSVQVNSNAQVTSLLLLTKTA